MYNGLGPNYYYLNMPSTLVFALDIRMQCTVFPVGWTLHLSRFTEKPLSQCYPNSLTLFSLDPSELCYVQIQKWERRTYKSIKYFSMVGATRTSKSLEKSRMMSFLCFYPQETPMTCYNNAHCPEIVQDVHFQTKVHESWTSLISRKFFLLPSACIPTAEHELGKWES